MSQDTGVVYSTRQAAEALGVGAAMVRRYAQKLEEITAQEIPQTRRDGRQFSQEQMRTLLQTKALVDSNNRLSVEAALRMVIQGQVEGLPVGLPHGIADSGVLIEALREAITDPILAELREPNAALLFAALSEAVTRPLVAELRDLRAAITELHAEVREQKVLPPSATPERIDQALKIEMREGIEAVETAAAVEEIRRVGEVVNGVEPQRREQES